MMMTNKHIEFEVQVKSNPFSMFGGGGGTSSTSDTSSVDPPGEGNYEVATEEDINKLAMALGGG